MLGRVRARCGRLRRPALVCADAEALPIADGRIDLIYSNLTLQWCNDTERTLREFKRVLAPGGLLLFTTLGPDTLSELRQSWADADALPHVNRFLDLHDIGDALLRSGFSDPVMDRENLTLTYPDTRRLMQDLKQIGAQNKIQGPTRPLDYPTGACPPAMRYSTATPGPPKPRRPRKAHRSRGRSASP
jgi:malonyl-CoA O-methyltransferase